MVRRRRGTEEQEERQEMAAPPNPIGTSGRRQPGCISASRARLVALFGGAEPQLPMDIRLRVCPAGIWDGQEQQAKLRAHNARSIRLDLEDVSAFQADNSRARVFSIHSWGPPLVLEACLEPPPKDTFITINKLRLLDLLGGNEPRLPMDATLRLCPGGVWNGEEQQVRVRSWNATAFRIDVEDLAVFQADNPCQRTFSLHSSGPPLVLAVRLVPQSQDLKLSMPAAQFASIFGGTPPRLPLDAAMRFSVSGAVWPKEHKIKVKSIGQQHALIELDACPAELRRMVKAHTHINRTYTLVVGGSCPLLQLDLVPCSSWRNRPSVGSMEPAAGAEASGRSAERGSARDDDGHLQQATSSDADKDPVMRSGGIGQRQGNCRAEGAAGAAVDGSGWRQQPASVAGVAEGTTAGAAAGVKEKKDKGVARGRREVEAGQTAAAGSEEQEEDVEGLERRLQRKRARREAKEREEAERQQQQERCKEKAEKATRKEEEAEAERQQALEERKTERKAARKQRREEEARQRELEEQQRRRERKAAKKQRMEEAREQKEQEQREKQKDEARRRKRAKMQRRLEAEGGTSGMIGEEQQQGEEQSRTEGGERLFAAPARMSGGTAATGSVCGWSRKQVADWLRSMGEQALVDGFVNSKVDGSALEGLHLLGFDGMVSQLALMCGPVPVGSRLKLWARLSQLFKGS